MKSEEDFLRLIRENSQAGFDCLYDQYCDLLYGIAVKAVGSEVYAEEVLQLAFANIYHAIKNGANPVTSLKYWVIRMLFCAIKEFLDSKNIDYVLKKDQFPNFSFELTQNKFV